MKLDERTHEVYWLISTSFQEERQFEFKNGTAYRRYRIAFNDVGSTESNDYMEFFKLEYGNTENAGRLHVVVPSGVVVTNSGVTLSGNLRLVKEGAGTLLAAKTGQTYETGTDVKAGTLTAGAAGTSTTLGAVGREVCVQSNAVFEANGKTGYGRYEFLLNGGTLENSGGEVTGSSDDQFRRIRLTAPSSLVAGSSSFIGVSEAGSSTIYLCGNTLNVTIATGKYLRLFNTAIFDGTVDIVSGGWLVSGGGGGNVATNVDFTVNCALYMAGTLAVRDYTARYYSVASNDKTAELGVCGTFRPETNCYYGCTMRAGSTMDLTAWPESAGWPLASAFTKGRTALGFADSGEISVNLAGRSDLKALAKSANPYIVAWASGTPVPGAEFVLDETSRAAGYMLVKDFTGLKLVSAKGFMLIVR